MAHDEPIDVRETALGASNRCALTKAKSHFAASARFRICSWSESLRPPTVTPSNKVFTSGKVKGFPSGTPASQTNSGSIRYFGIPTK